MDRINLYKGDITTLTVDAIVNAANTSLLGGGGVDGAIHRAAGKELLEECRSLNGCKTGDAKITKGYDLPARFVIHTVGPIYKNGDSNEAEKLTSCYERSLQLASENQLHTIAFPNISTGIYAYPKREAAGIAIQTVWNYLSEHIDIKAVTFCVFDEENHSIYKKLLAKYRQLI